MQHTSHPSTAQRRTESLKALVPYLDDEALTGNGSAEAIKACTAFYATTHDVSNETKFDRVEFAMRFVNFWLELQPLLATPELFWGLLEDMHACGALGEQEYWYAQRCRAVQLAGRTSHDGVFTHDEFEAAIGKVGSPYCDQTFDLAQLMHTTQDAFQRDEPGYAVMLECVDLYVSKYGIDRRMVSAAAFDWHAVAGPMNAGEYLEGDELDNFRAAGHEQFLIDTGLMMRRYPNEWRVVVNDWKILGRHDDPCKAVQAAREAYEEVREPVAA